MRKYAEIIFIQNSKEARTLIRMMRHGREQQVLKYLLQWDNGDAEEQSNKPWGDSDKIYHHRGYVISYNWHLDYISLTSVTERCNETLHIW